MLRQAQHERENLGMILDNPPFVLGLSKDERKVFQPESIFFLPNFDFRSLISSTQK